ncbi:MAG: hypothetical protein ACRCSN_12660 [Dermatophilaceae bacterium]
MTRGPARTDDAGPGPRTDDAGPGSYGSRHFDAMAAIWVRGVEM